MLEGSVSLWPQGNTVRLIPPSHEDPRLFWGVLGGADFRSLAPFRHAPDRRSIRAVTEVSVVEDDLSWRHDAHAEPEPEKTSRVLLYSDDRTVRQQLRMALGKRPAADLPALEYTEIATPEALIRAVDTAPFDLLILDGEAVPAGGMGLCRQLKDEIYRCPPILVVIGRPQDAWLATWSRADGVIGHPIEAIATATTVADLLRRTAGQ